MKKSEQQQFNIIFRTISFGAKETVPKKTCARILSQNTPSTFFYKPSVCIDFRLSGFPHVHHAINKIRHAEFISASHKTCRKEILKQVQDDMLQVQHDVGRKAVVVC